jgi:hypothetical protein
LRKTATVACAVHDAKAGPEHWLYEYRAVSDQQF